MRAAVFTAFRQPLEIQTVPDPTPSPTGVVIQVGATGLCRSDWHAWMGHDPDITLPHVPGHELAGTIAAVGSQVRHWKEGDRVTLPFQCGCGCCAECQAGHPQVCDHHFQPGFTAWGSFAEYVAIEYASHNLIPLPESLDFVHAASLGCRFVTAYRAIVPQAKVHEGQWLAIHGCGGVGLSAVMIGHAVGARVVAIDIDRAKLHLAGELGAEVIINARDTPDVVQAVRDATRGGAHVSIDALGHSETCFHSVANLRKRGKHIQIGLLLGDQSTPRLPMDQVIAKELEIHGSHGLPAHRYPSLLAMLSQGRLSPEKLVQRTLSLSEACTALPSMADFPGVGMTVINEF
ncbi:MAG: zinc-dependent alcohol dehydrogenase family protein [Verrucomicrobiota bacterium]